MHWHILKPFETVEAGPYRVTPLPANHMNPSHQPFVYHIVDTREDKSIFYMHDSGYYSPEVWDYLKAQKKPAELFSFDTTLGYEDCGFKSTHHGRGRRSSASRRNSKRSVLLTNTRTA